MSLSTLCPVTCQSFSCRESGIVGIPDTAAASPIVTITSGMFCSEIPGSTGEVKPSSTVVLLTPANAAACGEAAVIAVPVFTTAPVPQAKWSPYKRYVVGEKVYGQVSTADPFFGYVCIQDIPPFTAPNPYPPSNTAYWTKLVTTNAPVLPWCRTAGYAPGMYPGYTGFVSYQGRVYAVDGTIAANPAGNLPPSQDDVTWDLVPNGFQVSLTAGAASGLCLYNYFVMDTQGFLED